MLLQLTDSNFLCLLLSLASHLFFLGFVLWQLNDEEMIKRKTKNAPPGPGQGTVGMLTREEWEQFWEVRRMTPFESKLGGRKSKCTNKNRRTNTHAQYYLTSSYSARVVRFYGCPSCHLAFL